MVSGFKLSTHPMHKKSAQSHYNELIDSTVRDARPIKNQGTLLGAADNVGSARA